MYNRRLILPVFFCIFAPSFMHAQQPSISPDRQSAMLEAGRLMNAPAEFVLQHRQELALTGAQVASLEKLAAALRDSTVARMTHRAREAQKAGSTPGLANVMAWSGPIDEAAIRDAMRTQSALQAELMIASARDRRAVAALLTEEQRTKLPRLQADEMLKAARGGSR